MNGQSGERVETPNDTGTGGTQTQPQPRGTQTQPLPNASPLRPPTTNNSVPPIGSTTNAVSAGEKELDELSSSQSSAEPIPITKQMAIGGSRSTSTTMKLIPKGAQ